MDIGFYGRSRALRDYFVSLPEPVRERILESGVELATLGELMQCAEHIWHELRSETT